MSLTANLVAGCYERFLFGLHAHPSEDATEAAVKCVALHGPHLASGGNDDQIHLYNIQHRKDLGFLVNPGLGAITALAFVCQGAGAPASHLVSGSADGSLMLWRACKTWDALKPMRGHKGLVNTLAVHPTGALALSAGRDQQLMLWNLVKGKCAFHTKLAAEGLVLQTPPPSDSASTQRYGLLTARQLSVHDLEASEGSSVVTWDLPAASQCMAWCGNAGGSMLLVGSDDGSLRCFDHRHGGSEARAAIAHAHATRIKGVAGVGPWTVASACSGGEVKLWDVRAMQAPLAQHATGARLTCLAAAEELAAGGEGDQRVVKSSSKGGARGKKQQVVEEDKDRGVREEKAPSKAMGGKARRGATKGHQVNTAAAAKAPVTVDDRDRLARQGVVKDGVVEFVDSALRLKPAKKRRKRSAEEGPSLEAAEQAAMELGLNVDVHEQHAVIEEAREGTGRRGRGGGAGRGRGRGQRGRGRGRGGKSLQ